ncbi:hypothetical protein J6590_008832 [Homalodisca vitripennis]|nr:hypothetical protein J6590_008832 [Homalodisca vitripennis]
MCPMRYKSCAQPFTTFLFSIIDYRLSPRFTAASSDRWDRFAGVASVATPSPSVPTIVVRRHLGLHLCSPLRVVFGDDEGMTKTRPAPPGTTSSKGAGSRESSVVYRTVSGDSAKVDNQKLREGKGFYIPHQTLAGDMKFVQIVFPRRENTLGASVHLVTRFPNM